MAKTVKKDIDAGLEFIKFIKNLYKDQIQLNIDKFDSFTLVYDGNENKKIKIYFPKHSYTLLEGELDLTGSPKFRDWLCLKPGSVTIKNSLLDDLRKAKVSDFGTAAISDDGTTFTFNLMTDGVPVEYALTREDIAVNKKLDAFNNYTYSNMKLEAACFEKPIINIFMKDGVMNLADGTLIADIPVKSIFVIMKKEADYEVGYSENSENNTHILKLTASSGPISLKQYFRLI